MFVEAHRHPEVRRLHHVRLVRVDRLALLAHPLVEVVALRVKVEELERVLKNLLAFLAQLLKESVPLFDRCLSFLDDVFP